MSLKDKVVLISGASRGIGRAVAKLAEEEGARVFGISKTGKGDTFKADIRDYQQCQKAVKEAIDKFGRIDVLVNNAGVAGWGNLEKMPPASIEEQIDVNFKGMAFLTHAVLGAMRKEKGGVIVNIASGAGHGVFPGSAVYSATKHAVLALTASLAEEAREENIRVYSVSPGTTATEMTNFSGMNPEKVAKRIIQVVKEEAGLAPGQDSEIYY